ncbi:ComEC/Rec2 family competence protein [Sediminitomix flava]|uniref:ComEC/Rec2-related protein n=1 Tax=Sediminitomix flava TaxID=379075 RepID=A0A315ZCI0_SEDFL|nr:ComEC/Rec2 family competence protein [Sediminitomix flava]PWJ43286.1 ComEC/Rec2-related protein [Sediminitomix flava]
MYGYLGFSIYFLGILFLKNKVIKNFILISTIVFLGLFTYLNHQEIKHSNHLYHQEEITSYLTKVTSYEKETEKFKVYNSEVISFEDSSQKIKASLGKVHLYLSKEDTSSKTLEFGDIIFIRDAPQKLFAQNSYERYLRNQQIYLQHFIYNDQWQILQKNKAQTLLHHVWALRKTLENKLLQIIKEPRQQELAIALLLGNKSSLNDSTKTAFAQSGLAHILAVSGLHVSLVLLFFLWIFKYWDRRPPLIRFFYFTFFMTVLWGYATITAFSPSVVRAALMLSIWLLGKALQRPTDAFNTVGLSAFIQLIINPNLLFDIGFQLSYTAVIGILYLYPKWIKVYRFSFIPLQKLWEASLISLAAQLGTLPLCLYYFHQFPSYFLFSNIAITFLIPLVIGSGFLTLICSLISESIALYCSYLYDFFSDIMVYIAHFFSSLPYSTLSDIYLSSSELILLYLLIVTIILAFEYRSILSLRISLISGFLLLSSFTFKKIEDHTNEFFEIRYTKQDLFIAVKEYKLSPIIYTSSTTTNEKQLQAIFPNTYQQQFGKIDIIELDRLNKFYLWNYNGEKIIYFQSKKYDHTPSNICVDYLILTDKHQFNSTIKDLKFSPQKVIYLGYKDWNLQKWKSYFQTKNIEVIYPTEKNSYGIN